MTDRSTNGKLQSGSLNNPEKIEKGLKKYTLLDNDGSEEDKALEVKFNKAMESYPVRDEDEIAQQVKCCNDLYPITRKDVNKTFFCPECGKEFPAI